MGEGIVGEYTGTRLTMLPARLESWKKFRERVVTDQRLVIVIEGFMPGSVEDFDRIIPPRIIPLPEAHHVRADGLESVRQRQAGLVAGFIKIPRRMDLPFKRIFIQVVPPFGNTSGSPERRFHAWIVIKIAGRRKLRKVSHPLRFLKQ